MAKTLHYNFLTNPSLTDHTTGTSTPDLSFSRATSATMVDADGYIREVQSGEARFTGATFTNNISLYSEDLTTGWVETTCTHAADQIANPLTGAVNADSIVGNGSDTTARISQNLAVETKVGGKYLVSAYVKPIGTLEWIAPQWQTSGFIYFDIVNGTVGTAAGVWSDGAITSVGNGWYRISALATETTARTLNLRYWFAEGNLDLTFPSAIPATDGYYLWGVMVEDVSGTTRVTPSTYISTTAAAVTSLSGTSTKGLLAESVRTNICLQSEDFNTTWVSDATTPTANAGTAPDGSNTATDVIHTGAGELKQTMTVTADTVYTFSVFVHSGTTGTHDWVKLRYRDSAAANGIDAWFDLTSSAAVGTSQTFGTGTTLTGTNTEDYGNGWYRISLIGQLASGVTGARVEIYNTTTDGGETREQTNSTWVWGAQLEASAFLTSYIPTTTTSVTRNRDAIETTSFSITSALTLYASGSRLDGVTNQGDIVNLSDGSNNERFSLIARTTNAARLYTRDTAGVNADINGSANDWSTAVSRIVAGATTDDFALYFDGASQGTDTSGNLPVTTELQVGGLPAANEEWNGHIAEIAYFNERLANATLLDYSTNGLPTAFPGTVAGDGGHIWPPRANDPRWTQIITDSGITASGNFIDDVHEALEALASTTGAMDDLWKKFKAAYSVTDTSEPFTY